MKTKTTNQATRTKLTVKRDVLRRLSAEELSPVVGGGGRAGCCATSASGA
jgi:hypothetical protein